MEVFLQNFYLASKNNNKILEKVLATPPLNGLILPGIVRHSILQLSAEWKDYRVEERVFTMTELIEMLRCDRVKHIYFDIFQKLTAKF